MNFKEITNKYLETIEVQDKLILMAEKTRATEYEKYRQEIINVGNDIRVYTVFFNVTSYLLKRNLVGASHEEV